MLRFCAELDTLVTSALNNHVNQKSENAPSTRSMNTATHESLAAVVQEIEAVATYTVKSAVARAAARVNLLGPVHRLADDVLVAIFNRLDNQSVINAARVGARWRTVALSAPTLWSNIDFTIDTGLKAHLQLMLTRSQHAPIALKLRMWGFGPLDHDDPKEEAAAAAEAEAHMDLLDDLLKKQVSRLRSLSVQYDHTTFDYDAELSLPEAPMLANLDLDWGMSVAPLRLTVPRFHATNLFPALKRLKLCWVLDPLDVLPRFRNVTTLTLRFPRPFQTNSLSIDIKAVIKACSSLEDLALIGIGDVVDTAIICPSGIRPPAHFRMLLDGTRAHEVTNALCADFSSVTALPSLYVRDQTAMRKSTTAPALRIFDHLQPFIHNAVPSKLYVKHVRTASSDDFHYICGVEELGRARGIRTTGIDLKLLAPLVGAYAYLTVDFSVLVSPSFPASLMNTTTLRIRLKEKNLPIDLDHKIHAPALHNFELYFSRLRDDPTPSIIVHDVSNFLSCLFADLALPLDSLKILGAVCSNGDQLAVTRQLASEFVHAPAFDSDEFVFPPAMFPPEHFYC